MATQNTNPTDNIFSGLKVVDFSTFVAAPGAAVIQFVNYGEDPHDMRLQRAGGGRLYKTPILQPGAYYDLPVKLVPGDYHLWCSIANHRQLGMQALLVVT